MPGSVRRRVSQPERLLCTPQLIGTRVEELGEVATGYLQYKRALRFCFVPAVACLAAGSGIISSSPTTAKALVVVGYCLFALILLGVIAGETHILLTLSRRLNRDSRMVRGYRQLKMSCIADTIESRFSRAHWSPRLSSSSATCTASSMRPVKATSRQYGTPSMVRRCCLR